jgi:hypothetical protein
MLRRLTDEIRMSAPRVAGRLLAVAIKRTLNEADQSTIDMVDPAMEARVEKANALCRRCVAGRYELAPRRPGPARLSP